MTHTEIEKQNAELLAALSELHNAIQHEPIEGWSERLTNAVTTAYEVRKNAGLNSKLDKSYPINDYIKELHQYIDNLHKYIDKQC